MIVLNIKTIYIMKQIIKNFVLSVLKSIGIQTLAYDCLILSRKTDYLTEEGVISLNGAVVRGEDLKGWTFFARKKGENKFVYTVCNKDGRDIMSDTDKESLVKRFCSFLKRNEGFTMLT